MASGYYDITSKTLGKGHYGVVKLGRHCLTGEPVALKIIEKARLNPDSLNQLGTEIRILFRLSEYEHPNILKLYQTIDTEDKLYLVTEYCGPHACDLHDYLSRKHCREGLCEMEAQIFFIQICSAISYCHSMGIVHRDLKPENILVTDYKHMESKFFRNNKHSLGTKDNHNTNNNQHQFPLLKLIDFGFANQWYPDEKMRTSCGTLAYSAPELLLGEHYDGTKVDVWGLGLMLYILLYGGNPFMQINDNETLTKILDCSFATPKRDNVNCSAVELLRSLIKRNPDTRLPIDAILQHKWFSSVPKTFEAMWLKCQIKENSATSTPLTTSSTAITSANSSTNQTIKQQTKLSATQNVSSTLPSISEIGPLRSLNRRAKSDDSAKSEQTTCKPSYNRTRSLSITRSYNRTSQQHQQTPLTHTRSSMHLERLNSNNQSTSSRGSSIYRPTSPDVGGSSNILTEEESQLHDCVIQEMFRLTKLIDSKSSIEASLKNARFTHRHFNQNSIKPAKIGKKKLGSGLVKLLGHKKSEVVGNNPLEAPTLSEKPLKKDVIASGSHQDKLGTINTKLRNDDYIYATYQLTRDRILRVRKEKLKSKVSDKDQSDNSGINSNCTGNHSSVIAEESSSSINKEQGPRNDVVSAKENDCSRLARQRKLLQPQHKMRDKFTSFFRSGSTSPNASFSVPCESQSGGDALLKDQVDLFDANHEAFNDHDNEHTATSSTRYYANKTDTQENLMAYALPLARKCSLVSEESSCTNEPPDN